MTHDTIATTINVLIRAEQNGFYAKSADLPGLSVWGQTEEQVLDRVEQGIVLLYKLNSNIDVTVFRAANPQSFEVPRKAQSCNDYVVARAA